MSHMWLFFSLSFFLFFLKKKMAKNFFEANAHSIFAGSYERFLFGHSYGPNFSASFTAAGEEAFEEKERTQSFCAR